MQHANTSGLTPVAFVHGLNRGHALTIDSGWREVTHTALAFVQRCTQARA